MALVVSGLAWRKQHNAVDLAYWASVLCWLFYLIAASVKAQYGATPASTFALYATYQLAFITASFFLLVCASVVRFDMHAVWMAQGVVGLLSLLWCVWGPAYQRLAYGLWVVLNMVCAGVVVAYVGMRARRLGSYRCWLVFAIGLLGIGVAAQDMLTAGRLTMRTSLMQYVYAAILLLLWLLLTNRAGRPGAALAMPDTIAPSPGTGWMNIAVTDFGPLGQLSQAGGADAAASAVADERRRIAHDLHDGVGSQLVNILATLDAAAPNQQSVALALEQCLLDLKIMVDNIDSTNDSVLDALGRLRYRMQHSLDKLGISMVWNVDVEGPLQDFRGERAQHVLRIAQECLSNTMRHAHATVVEVVCHYVPDSASMLLEVRDNGIGIASRAAGRPSGKGLEYMHWRARQLGGELHLATRQNVGTRMSLRVPLQE